MVIGRSPPMLNTSPLHASLAPARRKASAASSHRRNRATASHHVDLDRVVLYREPDEPRDKSLAIVFDQLPRAVHIGQAERACPTPNTLL